MNKKRGCKEALVASKVIDYVRNDYISLNPKSTVELVLSDLQNKNISDKITYFYVVNNEQCLCGILPIRRLLVADKTKTIEEIMLTSVVTLSANASFKDAQQLFMQHKYLAFPVVDSEQKLLGIFDITVLTENSLNFQSNHRFDEAFELIGIHASIMQYLTPWKSFRLRFPWLMPTVIGGTFCAILASCFEQTIAKSILLTFFLTMILGLGESVSIQTFTITIRRLQVGKATWKWYFQSMLKEMMTALLLGLGIALILFTIVMIWQQKFFIGLSIGLSVILSLCSATLFGLTIPTLLHKTKLNPQVAAGPLILGLTDICTLIFYFTTASLLIRS